MLDIHIGDVMKRKYLPEDPKQWIMDNVKINKKTGCWIWTKLITKNPLRARIHFGYREKYNLVSCMASRSVFALFRPKDFDPDLDVLHTSACPAKLAYKCVNPAHLKMGDDKQNAIDKYQYGLGVQGEEHLNSRFTKAQVRKIKKLYSLGVGITDIIRCLGIYVSPRENPDLYHSNFVSVSYICNENTWKSV